jgi:hypothetical protein
MNDEKTSKRRYSGPPVPRLRRARLELVRLGLVRDSGARAPTTSGRMAILWELTEAGRAYQGDLDGIPAHPPADQPVTVTSYKAWKAWLVCPLCRLQYAEGTHHGWKAGMRCNDCSQGRRGRRCDGRLIPKKEFDLVEARGKRLTRRIRASVQEGE